MISLRLYAAYESAYVTIRSDPGVMWALFFVYWAVIDATVIK